MKLQELVDKVITDIRHYRPFGEEWTGKKYPQCEHRMAAWKIQLQQAVVSDSPIDYMYEQVFGDSQSEILEVNGIKHQWTND